MAHKPNPAYRVIVCFRKIWQLTFILEYNLESFENVLTLYDFKMCLLDLQI